MQAKRQRKKNAEEKKKKSSQIYGLKQSNVALLFLMSSKYETTIGHLLRSLMYIIIYLIGWQGLLLKECVMRCWIKHYLEKKPLSDGSLK